MKIDTTWCHIVWLDNSKEFYSDKKIKDKIYWKNNRTYITITNITNEV